MLAIIDYGIGNVGSIYNMLKHIGIPSIIVKEPAGILSASKLVLPGVGSFDNGMTLLNESGLRQPLEEKVMDKQTPILGICLGMQMMTSRSEEGNLPGLNWINAECIKFRLEETDSTLKVPHMGWSDIIRKDPEDCFFPIINNELRFYFAHSYHMVCPNEIVTAMAKYGYEFPVAFKKDNIYGVQFHPEKSHQFGMNFLNAFAK